LRRQSRRRNPWRRCLRSDDGGDTFGLYGRYRVLVHRHELQRRELLRAARLLYRRRRALRAPEARATRGGGRGGVVDAVFDALIPVRAAGDGEDRRQGDQSLWGRGAQGV